MEKQKYLPHIDGLRALSVILVILFHFNIFFIGGYIGVDVFFTISGYLIIGSIVSQLEKGIFSPLVFWQKRIRRLLPAILATLFLCLLAGFLIMNPANFSYLAKQSFFALFSIINFTLLGEVDYFDQSSVDEPLVHFWSLAVEEQFYFVFPILALVVFSFVKKKGNFKTVMAVLLVVLSIVSIIAAEYLIRIGQKSAAYYMMPTRFSQLALGGLLALFFQSHLSDKFKGNISPAIHSLIVLSGVAAIFIVALNFRPTTSFPGMNGLFPTFGALAVLASGGRCHGVFKNALENRASSYLGKLSYSLYLVHWPVWVFLSYLMNYRLDGFEVLWPIILTFGFGMIIYHFVEMPIRFSKRFKGKSMYKVIVPALGVFAICSGLVRSNKGLDFRINQEGRDFIKAYPNSENYHQTHFGGNGYGAGIITKLGNANVKPDFLIIGDSKARQLAGGLDEYLRTTGRQVVMINHDGCPFVTTALMYTNGTINTSCQSATQLATTFAAANNLPIVSFRSWVFYPDKMRDLNGRRYKFPKEIRAREFAKIYLEFHTKIRKTRPVLLIGDNAGFKNVKPISDCFSRPLWVRSLCLKVQSFSVDNFEVPDIESYMTESVQKYDHVNFIPMADIFCHDGRCSQIAKNGDILNSDPYHLSKFGARSVAPKLLKVIRDSFGLDEYIPQIVLDPCDAQTPDIKRIALTAPFNSTGDVGWHISLPELASQASNNEAPSRSVYTLCETGKTIGTSNALHANIRDIGKGDYSHWNDYLLFSTSDNSNPNENGRHYELVLSQDKP